MVVVSKFYITYYEINRYIIDVSHFKTRKSGNGMLDMEIICIRQMMTECKQMLMRQCEMSAILIMNSYIVYIYKSIVSMRFRKEEERKRGLPEMYSMYTVSLDTNCNDD